MFQGISLYQIIVATVALLFIGNELKKIIKRVHYSLVKVLTTILVWVGILVFSVFPDLSHIASTQLGLGENLNTLIFTGFIVVFFAVFKLVNRTEKINRSITELVRKEAIEEALVAKDKKA